MSGHASVYPELWDGSTGRAIDEGWMSEADPDKREAGRILAQHTLIVRDYLLTNRLSRAALWGLYRLPFSTIVEDLKCLTESEIRAALHRLSEPDVDFAVYGATSRTMWVKNYMRYQFPKGLKKAESGKAENGQRLSLLRDLPMLSKLEFFGQWYERYRNACDLPPIKDIGSVLNQPPKRAAGLLSNAKPYVAPVLPAAVKADMIMALQEVAGVPEPEFPGDASKQAPEPEPEVEPEPVAAPAELEEEIPDPADPYLETLDAEGNVILTAHLLAHGFNQLAAIPFGLPQARIPVSSDRVRHAKVRLEENPDPKWWGIVFVRIGSSSFLCGKNPRRWRADFDWIIRPGNADRVLEGKYDDNQSEDAGAQAR